RFSLFSAVPSAPFGPASPHASCISRCPPSSGNRAPLYFFKPRSLLSTGARRCTRAACPPGRLLPAVAPLGEPASCDRKPATRQHTFNPSVYTIVSFFRRRSCDRPQRLWLAPPGSHPHVQFPPRTALSHLSIIAQ